MVFCHNASIPTNGRALAMVARITEPKRAPITEPRPPVHADTADNTGSDDIHLTALLHIRHCRSVYRYLQCTAKAGKKSHDGVNHQLNILHIDTGNLCCAGIASYCIDLSSGSRPLHEEEEDHITDDDDPDHAIQSQEIGGCKIF